MKHRWRFLLRQYLASGFVMLIMWAVLMFTYFYEAADPSAFSLGVALVTLGVAGPLAFLTMLDMGFGRRERPVKVYMTNDAYEEVRYRMRGSEHENEMVAWRP